MRVFDGVAELQRRLVRFVHLRCDVCLALLELLGKLGVLPPLARGLLHLLHLALGPLPAPAHLARQLRALALARRRSTDCAPDEALARALPRRCV